MYLHPQFSGKGAETVMKSLQFFPDTRDVLSVVADKMEPMRKNVSNACKLIDLNSNSIKTLYTEKIG